jgi:hypothetical protein
LLTEHPGIDKVSFTGGVVSGKKVMANAVGADLARAVEVGHHGDVSRQIEIGVIKDDQR